VKSRSADWEAWMREKQLKEKVLDNTCLGFMTTLARSVDFAERMDHVHGYHLAFDRMRAAKIIP